MGTALAFAASLRAAPALGGPVEQLAELALSPGDPAVMLLRYTNGRDGFFYTRDGGKSWGLLCSSAVEPGLRGLGPVALTADGLAVMGGDDGLWEDPGGGCAWTQRSATPNLRITDVAAHPTEPGVAFAVDPASGLWRRDARGTWSATPSGPGGLESLRVATTATGLRLYATAFNRTTMATVLRVSDDEGGTWRETPVRRADGTVRVRAVDPTNPDRMVASVERVGAPDGIWVTSDQGATFEPILELDAVGGVAFASDGRLFVGGFGEGSGAPRDRGLWAFASAADAPLLVADWDVRCLGFEPVAGTLYACQRWRFGTVDPATGEFTDSLRVERAPAFVACGGRDLRAACEPQLCADYCAFDHFPDAPVCAGYRTPTCGPTSAPDSGAGLGPDGGTVQPGLRARGGCSVVRGALRLPAPSGAAALLLLLFFRRRVSTADSIRSMPAARCIRPSSAARRRGPSRPTRPGSDGCRSARSSRGGWRTPG